MEMTSTEWLPAVVILVVGLIGGAFAAWFFGLRKGSAAAAPRKVVEVDVDLREEEAQRDSILAQLREMDVVAATADTPSRRYKLELDLAKALMAIDGLHHQAETIEEEEVVPQAAPSKPSATKGFAWGLGSAAAVGGLVLLVMNLATPKEQQQEGMMAGGGSQAAPTSVSSPEIEQLKAVIQSNPDDFNARIALARASLASDNMMETFQQTSYVLQRDPNHTGALAYQALVRFAMGQGDMAVEMLDKATSLDPKFVDAWVNMAIVKANLGKMDDASKAIDKAIEVAPSDTAALNEIRDELRRQAEAAKLSPPPGMGAPGEENPHANLGQMPPAGATPAVAAVPAGQAVSGMLTLDPSLNGKVRTPAVVFVIARPEGQTAGPPAAVARLNVTSFPAPFTISSANSMMGTPLPPKMRLDVRIDSDGDVTTKTGDPTGFADSLAVGKGDANIVIR